MATAPARSPVLIAALDYASRGWPVFPCHPEHKRPLTENGFKNASTDHALIEEWWARWPNAMVACPTGEAVGAFVLDVDDPATFEAAAKSIDLTLPATARSDTGKGYHLWFAWDRERPVRNAQQKVAGGSKAWPFPELPGADVRGEGGYVILPPSRHPSGRLYRWAREEDPSEAPDDLMAIVGKRRDPSPPADRQIPANDPKAGDFGALANAIYGEDTRYGLAALDAECAQISTAPAGAQEGTLNDGALRIGSLVGAGKLSFQTASGRLIAAGLSMGSANERDPWTPQGIAAKVDRALRDGMTTPRVKGAGDQQPREAAKAQSKVANTTGLPIERFADIQPKLVGLWRVKGLVPAGGQIVVHGHPNCGKSFVVMDMAFHVALGWDWHGRRTKAGAVVYVAAEGLTGLRNRVVAFRRENRVSEMPFSLIPTPIDMQAPDTDITRLIAAIRAEVAHYGVPIAMVVLDTLSKTFGAGKENTDDMVSYVANLGRVAAEFDCSVVVIHHRPKDAESEEPRGHSSLKGGADTVILVEAGATKTARVVKQRDGETGISILFKLKVVELGLDEDGDAVTTCVVEPAMFDDRPKADPIGLAISKLPDGVKVIYQQLIEVIETAGIPIPSDIPNNEIDRRRTGKVAATGTWREKVLMAGGTERDTTRDTAKRAFNRALTRLQKDGIVRVWGEWCWREYGAPGQGGTDQPGHSRDTGHAGTSPLEGCPVVPPRSMARIGFVHGNPALGRVQDDDDPAADEFAGDRRPRF